MKIELIEIKNYKAFKHAIMKDIPNLCVVVGANGSGKTTLFDIFDFLGTAIERGLNYATDIRGGYNNLISRGSSESVTLFFQVSDEDTAQKYNYSLNFEKVDGKLQVVSEYLEVGNKSEDICNRIFENRLGSLASQSDEGEEKVFNLAKKDTLGLSALAQFESYSRIIKFVTFIKSWHLSYFNIDEARNNNLSEHKQLLSRNADNLNSILHKIYTEDQDVYDIIINKLRDSIGGISEIKTKITEGGKILLSFRDGNFLEPFSANMVSDGTIKMLAFLVLLYSQNFYSLLCIEEPENQLYPKLLTELAEEFRLYANKGGQVFVSTHSPDFLNAMKIEEVFWLEKKNGYTSIKRADDNEQLRIYMENGDQMGYLWTQGFFEEVDRI